MEVLKKLSYLLLFITINSFSQDSTFVDCFGTPSPENWLSDGFCDDGSYTWNGNPIDFNCEEFGYDAGDCEAPIDTVLGCVDPLALNYDSLANVDNNSCQFPVLGCTDQDANNYNPWAQVDNGSCINTECSDGEARMILEVTLDQYPNETGWILTDISTGQPVESVLGNTYNYNQANTTISYSLCAPEFGVELIISDTYGDGMQGSLYSGGVDGNFVILGDLEPCGVLDTLWSLPDAGFGNAAYSGVIQLENCPIPVVYGCMDPDYIEYNPFADVDDGSCTNPHTLGCLNPSSFNYNPEATLNDIIPSCDYTLIIEDDAGDGWGDSYIGLVQGGVSIGTYTVVAGEYYQEFEITLSTDKPIDIYYFEIGKPQQPQAEVEFQTMHNSFRLINSNGVTTIQAGTNPFMNNGAGILKAYQAPFWHVYSVMPYCGDYCIPVVEGCLDPFALNYDSLANTQSEECIDIVLGCTNDLAFNYNAEANVDDESCEAIVYGCMDNQAWNYNAESNIDDGNCIYLGCTDSEACNYDQEANADNGGCFYPVEVYEDCNGDCLNDIDLDEVCDELEVVGCTNPLSINFMPEATDSSDDCIPYVYGCTNEASFNYEPLANTDDESCVDVIEGCTDPSMFNFNIAANTDNGLCVEVVIGCMDATMYNYNEEANTESNNCISFVFGCGDSTAFNYDPLSNSDNGTCLEYIYGCINPQSLNYNQDANTDDGSCINIIYGCTDSSAYNYNPLANTDNQSCEGIVYGCTNPIALNYILDANLDDGSCITPIYGCTDNTMYNYNPLANSDNQSCVSFIYGCDDPNALNYNAEANTDDNTCILPIYGCMDSTAFNYDVLANADNQSCIEVVYGCTDPAAFNYSVNANTEDFSCIDIVLGCTNPESFNYDETANTDNDACIDIIEGCMDQMAHNYSEFSNTEDGSCLYDAGCVDGPGNPYWLNDTCYAWVLMVDPYCCNNEWDDKCQELYWSCSWDSPLDTRDLLRGHNVVMYPVPVTDYINILTNGKVEVVVYDSAGKVVIHVKERYTKKGLNQLNMSLLNSGVYYFSVTYDGVTTTKSILKK